MLTLEQAMRMRLDDVTCTAVFDVAAGGWVGRVETGEGVLLFQAPPWWPTEKAAQGLVAMLLDYWRGLDDAHLRLAVFAAAHMAHGPLTFSRFNVALSAYQQLP